MEKGCLDSLPFIGEMTINEKDFLIKNILIKEIGINENTMGNGSCDGLIILIEGKLRVYMTSENGKEITLYHLFPKDVCILSYKCKIGDLPFNIQVSTVENSTIYNIPESVLKVFYEKYPSIKQFLFEEMSKRFSNVMGVVEKVAFQSLDQRLIELLLKESKRVIYKTHADLSQDLGTSREIISRLLKNFENDGLIELSRGKIKILEIKKLNDIIQK